MQNSSPSLGAALREWWADQRSREGFFASLRTLVKELWGFLRDSSPQRERQRYGDMEYDWDRRVNTTSAAVGWRNRLIGLFHSAYQPTDPVYFQEMIESVRGLGVDLAQFTFVDLGSGKGRTLLMASEYPFRRIVGVELLPELNELARENIAVFQSDSRKCLAVESICADARTFELPTEPLLLYLFNPLLESGMVRVVHNVERSLKSNPRRVIVVYHNPQLARVLDSSSALKKIHVSQYYAVYGDDNGPDCTQHSQALR